MFSQKINTITDRYSMLVWFVVFVWKFLHRFSTAIQTFDRAHTRCLLTSRILYEKKQVDEIKGFFFSFHYIEASGICFVDSKKKNKNCPRGVIFRLLFLTMNQRIRSKNKTLLLVSVYLFIYLIHCRINFTRTCCCWMKICNKMMF